MTVGRTEETCVGSKKEGSKGDMKKKPLTFTALSTIAVQSGQTQIVVSILKSGPSVHLQLVHVEPGLCEIGSDQEENQNLIQEQKQLLEKLQKHEGEVLSSVDKKRVEQRRQRKDDWICEQRSPQEDQEGVYRAMETSLREGWTLLLRLLDRRLHTLTLTADFYHTVKEFALGIERLEDLEIKPGRLNDAQLTYISIRRDLLGKSLQLLGISSDLMKKLRELQKTEALQRQGQVLQEEDEEDQESSQCSGATVLRLERVVEMLQDRRRAVDQEVKLQIQQAQKNNTKTSHSEQSVENQEWTLEEILAQDLSFTPEEESDLELKWEKTTELPSASSASIRADDNTFTSNSSLESMSSNEVLNLQSAYKLVEEQQLRVESRNENREPTPTYGYEEAQETSEDEATSRESLESLSQVKEELELEDFMNFEAEPETELQNLRSESAEFYISSLTKDFKLDVATTKTSDETLEVRSSSNCAKEQESGSKLEFRPRSLPIFNLASLQLHSELQGTNEIKIITDESVERPEPKLKSDDFNSGVKSHHTVIDSENLQEDHNGERSTDLDAELLPRLPNLKVVHNESGSNEMDNINFEIQTNTSNEGVPETKQSSTDNLLSRSDSKEESPVRTKLEHRSRSLPIFNIVSKKLQPKLQETKDLLNINNDTEALLEEKTQAKPLEITHRQSEVNGQCNDHKTAENPNNEKSLIVKQENVSALDNDVEIEETNELDIYSSMNIIKEINIVSDQGTIDESSEEPGYTVNLKSDSELTPMHQHEPQQDATETKSESFSERFKKLQSKWQEKEDVPLVPKTAPYKVKNQNPVSNNKPKQHVQEVSILKDQWENKEIEGHVQHNAEDSTVMLSSFEDLSDEHLVHETEDNTAKEEISTVEKYEDAFDHSTPKLKQEENSKLRLEETEKLHKSYDQLAVKVRVWLDHCTCELSVSSNPGHSLSEAQHVLNINIQLQCEVETAEEDVVTMVQIVDHLQALCSEFSGDTSVSSPQLTVQVEAIKKDLSTVKATIQSNIQLQQAYISVLQTAEEAKLDFEHLKQVYSTKPEMEETEEERRWQAAQQKFLMMQELGNHFNSDRREVRETPEHLESVVHVVTETMEHLKQTQEEVEELRKHHLIQMQNLRDDKEFCLRYSERLKKTVKDLQCVSELLDSCTGIDLGSEQHTSRLRQQFTQARPHFTQLDTEANFVTSNFETLRRLQKRHGLRITENVTEEDVSALLDLHLKLKQKIEESEAILDLSGNFHLIIKQLETLLQNKPLNSILGSCAEEKLNLLKMEKEQIHNQFNRASNLKMDICDGVKNSSVTGLRVQQLEASLQSVDSLRMSWLHETAEYEEKVLREMKTQALLHDIHVIRDSFKDLKKRFSNMKINYLKRNDRSRNIKAVRNQLQQVDSYEDKLQSLKSRLQALTARLQSEVKDGGSTRELEDLLNELHRQMGECERSIKEHRKTLDMTCSLQEAMDEYQLWCEEASGTIARVGKFSTECRSTEAVAVLYRQFEKFVWPTVPQQEERISQITELAVRLHGVDEGRRYIEKTLSKHSEMVTAIRALSDGLLELEGKLKLANLKQQQQKESTQVEMKEKLMEESGKEKVKRNSMNEMKDEAKLKVKDQIDNRRAQEAAEMHELKETGHTPELSNKHDGKELPVRRHSFSKKPPMHKNRTQETDRQASSSFCSTHTFSMSCSPLETSRQVYAIISEPQAAVAQITPTHLPPSPREVHKAKREDTHNTPQETGAGSLYETELHHHHEVLSEDSLSTDEYECPSPDDISLPPLAETPESIMVQSDLEEGVCFGSQHSHRSHVQSEHRESSEINQHSVNRFRTESGTFVPSPLAMPIQTQVQAEFTTTVHTITTEATIITPEQTNVYDNIPDQPSRNTQLIPPVPTLKDKKPSLNVSFSASSNFSEELPHLRQDDSLLKSFPVCRSSIHQQITSFEMKNVSSKSSTSGNCEKSQLDHVLNDVDADIKPTENEVPIDTLCNNDTTPIFQRNQLHNDFSNALKHNSTSPKSVQSTELSGNCKQKETVLCQEESLKCGQSSSITKAEEAKNVSTVTACNNRTTTIIKETVFSQSSMSSRSVIQAFSNPALNKGKSEDDTAGTSDQDLSSEGNILRTPNKDIEDEMASHNKEFKNTLVSNSFEDDVTNPQEVLCGSSAKEPDSIDLLSPSCKATSSATNINIKQNHQTVYHETSTDQCVHDPGFCAHPCPTPLSEAQTQVLAQQANTHVTPPYTSPHLLTPDQDPDICQPCTIREEIRLTPQIKGPSIPPHAQKECSCFTRPVSKAAVVGGSPVTLEVEVTGQPEPMLTWCKDDTEEEEQVQVENQRYEEAKAMDGAVCEAWLSAVGTKENKSSNDEGEDRGLMVEMHDIIMGDWQTWFGTLCFLLWLLFLIVI